MKKFVKVWSARSFILVSLGLFIFFWAAYSVMLHYGSQSNDKAHDCAKLATWLTVHGAIGIVAMILFTLFLTILFKRPSCISEDALIVSQLGAQCCFTTTMLGLWIWGLVLIYGRATEMCSDPEYLSGLWFINGIWIVLCVSSCCLLCCIPLVCYFDI